MTFSNHNIFITLLFVLCSSNAVSQSMILKDSNDQIPIPNVSIYNSDKSSFILSDFDGKFDLSLFNKSDTLHFSHISYQKLEIKVETLLSSWDDSVIFLNSKEQSLSEVILRMPID